MVVGENQSGKGAEGLPKVKGNQSVKAAKGPQKGKSTTAANDKTERKNPVSRSFRAGLQVLMFSNIDTAISF